MIAPGRSRRVVVGRRTCLRLFLALIVGLTVAFRSPSDAASSRLVAIGDVHGDADALAGILQRAQLIDQSHRWIGGSATLVQTGDVTDRGAKVREALDLLMSLEEQAPASGGRVVALLGNHEVMNILGDATNVTPAIYGTFTDEQSQTRREQAWDAYVKWCAARATGRTSPPEIYKLPDRNAWMETHPPGYFEYREAFGPDGRYGRWLRERPAVVQIGDTVFLHGGISAAYASQKPTSLSKQVQKEIKAFDEYRAYLVKNDLALPWFTAQELLRAARAELEALNERPTQSSSGDSFRANGVGGLDAHRIQTLQNLLRIGEWTSVKPDGPLWFRGYAMWTPEDGAKQIQPILKRLGASHVVVGHTIPMTMRVTARFRASVFLIDTGMLSSHYPGGRASALEIQDGIFTALYQDDSKVLLSPGSDPAPEGY